MFIHTWNQKRRSMRRFGLVIIAAVMTFAGFYQLVFAADANQKSFKSPEEAVRALSDAVKGNDTKELLTIFGPEGKELISSGDKVADETGRVILTLSVNSNTGQETFNPCLGEFGKIGDSKEELTDPVQQGEAIETNFLKPLWTRTSVRQTCNPAAFFLF